MMTVCDIQRWLGTLKADECVWIEEGGLMLETGEGNYLEVGGAPDE